jgi:hypothetical protein
VDRHFATGQIDIVPFQSENFRRAAQATEAAQSDDRSPLRVGSVLDAVLKSFRMNEVLAFRIAALRANQILKRIRFNESAFDGERFARGTSGFRV